jgi:hypothetical protein
MDRHHGLAVLLIEATSNADSVTHLGQNRRPQNDHQFAGACGDRYCVGDAVARRKRENDVPIVVCAAHEKGRD